MADLVVRSRWYASLRESILDLDGLSQFCVDLAKVWVERGYEQGVTLAPFEQRTYAITGEFFVKDPYCKVYKALFSTMEALAAQMAAVRYRRALPVLQVHC